MSITPAQQQTRVAPAIVRWWDPFREMEDVYDRIGHLFQDLITDPSTLTAGRLGLPTAVDIEETDDAYIVDLDLPSVKREDINVELRDNVLRVSGEIKERERKGIVRRQMRRVGQFEHVVTLPGDVDPNQVEATLHDGVLTLRVPKAKGAQARRIEVKSS